MSGSAGTTQPLTVRLYASGSAAFLGGEREQVAATTVSVSDQARKVIEIPLLGSISPGAELVAAVFTPHGQGVTHFSLAVMPPVSSRRACCL
jgi:hypothetical protein